MEKEANFINFKINISDLKKIINEKIQMELKTFKIESAKHLSESLTHSTGNLLKEECKAKGKISAKHSRMIEKFKKYKGPSNITGCSNSNLPAKELPLWDIMPAEFKKKCQNPRTLSSQNKPSATSGTSTITKKNSF